jgi:hypothetical protein
MSGKETFHTHALQESNLGTDRLIDIFDFPLTSTRNTYIEYLQTGFSSSIPLLTQRQQDTTTLRESNPHLVEEIHALVSSPHTKEAEALLLSHTPTETSTVAEGQVYFTGEHTKPLNRIPFLLTILVFLKIYVAPVLALLTPLLLAIMPYIIMNTVMDMQIPWDVYVPTMKQMVFGIQGGQQWSLKHYAQAGWTLLSVGQGMVMPFLTAYHTYNLDEVICKRGNAVLYLHGVATECIARLEGLNLSTRLYVPECPTDPRAAAAWYDESPLERKALLTCLGRVSLLTSIARNTHWTPVSFTTHATQPLQLENLCDLSIPSQKARHSALTLQGHSLLTGPNRGGKSSSLRAIVQQVLLGQTFGYTFGATGSWKPFHTVYTRLASLDTAGKESLFEMEVRYASQILRGKGNQRHSLVLIDELFHSTNPPDAEISARVFLSQLWETGFWKSIVSTHIFQLCEHASNANQTHVQTLCCPATERPDGSIEYSYMLQPGICRTSSVREVLRESGLLRLNENEKSA